MKILMLSPTFPWPLNIGDKIRIYHMLKELSRCHDITLISLVHREEEMAKKEETVRKHCSELHVIQACKSRRRAAIGAVFSFQPYRVVKFSSPHLRRLMNQVLRMESFDIVWIHFLNMAAYLTPALSQRALTVLDQHNADELMWESYAGEGNWAVRAFARQNLWKLRRFQQKVFKQVNVVLSVSEQEAEFMRGRTPPSCQVWALPNGVDIEYFHPSSSSEQKGNVILFCGSMDIMMNVDAVLRFTREIFPLVRREIPNAEFWIVGRNPDPKVTGLEKYEGVKVTGTVDDVRLYYERAKVATASFRYGAGTKLKILEAMAMEVPVVSTRIGCQGIEAVHEHHLFVEDENHHFAQRVIKLLQDEGLRQTVGLAGRQLVEEKYSWKSIITSVMRRWKELIQEKRARMGGAT